ncbi:MAG TPA: hypothetical protein VK254_00445 [Candidatus Bathyarchaeia archaeon]|nr:hypothetical protein [Candidatus Bathyarchaeia archaeon]
MKARLGLVIFLVVLFLPDGVLANRSDFAKFKNTLQKVGFHELPDRRLDDGSLMRVLQRIDCLFEIECVFRGEKLHSLRICFPEDFPQKTVVETVSYALPMFGREIKREEYFDIVRDMVSNPSNVCPYRCGDIVGRSIRGSYLEIPMRQLEFQAK